VQIDVASHLTTCWHSALWHTQQQKKAYGNWEDWAKVGMAMKSSNPNGIDNFIRFSKINKDKYDKHETVKFWEGIKIKDENDNKLSMGTLMKWAKESNKKGLCV
jgi:hypothetical protein